ncbi:hypothetical protein ASF84_23420 [Pseudomonas sp. Leaf127]|uniref:DUF5691 domain-containing protein n=1 Tax=Pseudomonas sp. Leaf127 TaxID=1736267 RepID=UPI0007024D99|nr:DUF5691 domain-containing protein [Pseudomonas sp. Leaf127]KQQ49254.1 hypothetical protein ASF84_23420 [Pseudomonas sp. Leaf127]
MSLLEPLAVTALLGTRKQALAPLAVEGPIGPLLDAIARDSASDEARLLRSAAVLDMCQHAGWLAPEATTAAAAPAPEDTLALPPEQSFGVLSQMLAEGYPRLGQLTLLQLAQRQLRLPPSLLPELLDRARRDAYLRGLLAPVLGERGRWLAERNPAWQVQAIDRREALNDEIWSLGSLEQRQVYLSALREQDPVAARELLVAGRKDFDARERSALLAALATGLSADDEPLLDEWSRDRSKEVRRVAAELLMDLPDSAYRRRMAARLALCVNVTPAAAEPGGLKGLFKRLTHSGSNAPTVQIEPPQAFFDNGKDDQIEEAVPNGEGLGQRAWWLYQVVAAAPLQTWRDHQGLTPHDWIAAAGRSDWDEALIRGWYQSTLREGDAEWAAALLDRISATGLRLARCFLDSQPLIALLPVPEREGHWLRLAHHIEDRNSLSLSELLAQILAAIPVQSRPGTAFCEQLLPHLRIGIALPRSVYDYNLRHNLRDFATLLPPELFAQARQGWPDDEALHRHQSEALHDWHNTLNLREHLQTLLD